MQLFCRTFQLVLAAIMFVLVAGGAGGCRAIDLHRDADTGDINARYVNVGFDTQIGNLKVNRQADGAFTIEVSDVNSQAGIARAIAEGVTAGLAP